MLAVLICHSSAIFVQGTTSNRIAAMNAAGWLAIEQGGQPISTLAPRHCKDGTGKGVSSQNARRTVIENLNVAKNTALPAPHWTGAKSGGSLSSIVVTDRFYPSTQIRSGCGSFTGPKGPRDASNNRFAANTASSMTVTPTPQSISESQVLPRPK
jgi:hypothetical protein